MNVRGADFLVSYVDNLEMAVEFYQDTLGLRLNLYKPDWNWAEFDIPPTTLVLFGIYDGAPLPGGKGGSAVALAVDDFEHALAELKAKGVNVEWGPNELSACHVAMISDPAGNAVFIHRRKDGSWG